MIFKEALREELMNPLPGIEYQEKLMPFNRPDIKPDSIKGVEAAVSIIILAAGEPMRFILMKRPEYAGHHSGQVSFPGGKFDSADKSLFHTAIRETYEEIGIHLRRNEYLGKITPLFIPVSGFRVVPFIFCLSRKVNFNLQLDEVQYLVFPELKKLLDHTTIRRTQLKVRTYHIDTPYFDLENEVVWGATSMILAEFKELLKRTVNKNPGIL